MQTGITGSNSTIGIAVLSFIYIILLVSYEAHTISHCFFQYDVCAPDAHSSEIGSRVDGNEATYIEFKVSKTITKRAKEDICKHKLEEIRRMIRNI